MGGTASILQTHTIKKSTQIEDIPPIPPIPAYTPQTYPGIHLTNLSIESLRFLDTITNKNPAVFNRLLVKLNELYNPNDRQLALKAHHVDAVIRILHIQTMLKANIAQSLKNYLMQENPDIHQIVNRLRKRYLPHISLQASAANLLHHTLQHASEIKNRSMAVITHDLGLFASKTDHFDIFLRTIIRFIIECHDHEQTNPQHYGSVEQATAARITEWLTTPPLGLPNLSNHLKNAVHFLSEYITSLGTTMIWSPISTMDLSYLFKSIEQLAHEADIPVIDESNIDFVEKIRMSALITGICDKTPAALLPVVKRQSDLPQTNSLSYLNKYYKIKPHQIEQYAEKSLFQVFFENTEYPFIPYYPHESLQYNYQALLMGLPSKLGMEVEFANLKEQEHNDAVALGNFIKYYQRVHKLFEANSETRSDFFRELELAFEQNNVVKLVENLFFSREKITKEINFSMSQTMNLELAKSEISVFLAKQKNNNPTPSPGLFFSYSERITPDELINSTVPATDAANLEALYQFYLGLPAAGKKRLIQEMTLNMVLQAGTIYLEQPRSGTSSEAATPIDTPRSPTKFKPIEHFEITESVTIHPMLTSVFQAHEDHSTFFGEDVKFDDTQSIKKTNY
ncbi:MAG: hypothetical protein Q8R83_11730 [Legionellaceae bacterium]|nr:hypothetical protein [Legionellaceae bacterium]